MAREAAESLRTVGKSSYDSPLGVMAHEVAVVQQVTKFDPYVIVGVVFVLVAPPR